MKKIGKFFAKLGAFTYLVQVGFGIGAGLFFGYYMAANFSVEEVERIVSCVAHKTP